MIRYYLLIMGIFLALGLIPKSHRLMNSLAAGNALLHLVLTFAALIFLDLPAQYGNYLYLDHLNLYVELITALGFSATAFYAKGYTDSLMEAGDLDPKNLNIAIDNVVAELGTRSKARGRTASVPPLRTHRSPMRRF